MQQITKKGGNAAETGGFHRDEIAGLSTQESDLAIEFDSGVPARTYKQLLRAESKGMFNSEIREIIRTCK